MVERWDRVRDWPVVYVEKLGDSGVARVVMNRPEKRNALDEQLLANFLDALEAIRDDHTINVVISAGNGPSYCSGMDLHYLRAFYQKPPPDWDRSGLNFTLFEAIRQFPKVTIAQVQGFCLGGGLALMTAHDLVVAARQAQIGMPEIIRGSFGVYATSTLLHSGIPLKKSALIQLTGDNLSGDEAERLGLVSRVVDERELEAASTQLATSIATRHPAALAHAKIATNMGRDVPLAEAMRIDQLVGARQQLAIDPLSDVDNYLRSQRGATNVTYRRPDVRDVRNDVKP